VCLAAAQPPREVANASADASSQYRNFFAAMGTPVDGEGMLALCTDLVGLRAHSALLSRLIYSSSSRRPCPGRGRAPVNTAFASADLMRRNAGAASDLESGELAA
jgi:hypothetical protein